MRPEWKRAPKGWSKGKLVECAYVAITLAALNVHFAARGNRIDSSVQIWQVKVGGKGEGAQERVQISSGRAPPSASSDAWRDVLLTLYTPTWNNPSASIPLPPPPPPSFRRAIPEDLADLAETRPRLFISIYFEHRIPALISFGLIAPCYEASGSRSIFYHRSKWFCIVAEPFLITLCTATGS